MRRLFSITLACVALAGCASSLLEPQWLNDARAREAETLAAQQIRSQDRFFRATVPAKLAAPVTRQEETYHVQLDIGSETPVECLVHREGLDMSASLALFSDATFEAISESLGEIRARRIEQVDAGAIGSSPYMAIDWLYQIGMGSSFQIGGVKHLIASKDGRGVYCHHNEVGYAKSFRRAVDGLVDSLRYAKPRGARPYFSQVSTLTIKGMRVGVEHTTLTRDQDGDTRTALLIPVSSDTLQSSDTYAVEFAEPDGDLLNQVHVESANGELVTHLKLDPSSGGNWRVGGTLQTKPISGEIQTSGRPTSWLGEALALRRALADGGIGGEVTLMRWVPQADPLRLVDETLAIERQVDPERFGAKLTMAGIEADLVVDRKGSVASGSLDMGFGSMAIERVYMGGTF